MLALTKNENNAFCANSPPTAHKQNKYKQHLKTQYQPMKLGHACAAELLEGPLRTDLA